MIWLSPTNGTNDCSIYFEIRDIDLQCHGNVTSGVVRGLLGDGYCELWGEVFLGSVEYAQILPVWTAYSGVIRPPIPLQSGPPVPEQTGPVIPV